MITVACAWATVWLILASVTAYARSILAGHEQPVRRAVMRARWAWRCRKPPARTEGTLSLADYLTFVGLAETWRQPAYGEEPQRSRT